MVAQAEYAVVISMDQASEFNNGKFEGWGTSFCWWPNRIGYSEALSEKAAELFYDPKTGLGLNIIRYNIGGGDDPTHDHIKRTDSMVPGYAVNPTYEDGTYSWEYDWSADANQRNVLLKVMESYADGLIVEGFSNSPPYFMTNSGCSSGAVDASKNNLKDDAYEAFATYLVDVAEHFSDEWGVRFQSMTGMNEPHTNYWGAYSEKQEGCHFEMGEAQSKMITVLRNELDERGMEDIQVSGTDETSVDTQTNTFYMLSEEAKAAITRIDTHSYSVNQYKPLKVAAKKFEKNLWMSEVDGGEVAGEDAGEMGAALWLGKKIVRDMNGLTPSAWILWQVIDSHISEEGYLGRKDSGKPDFEGGYWGLATADHDNEEIILTMKYYAMGQFSRYIRPGDTVIAADARSIAAYNAEENRLVIVAVNDTKDEMAYSFDLSEFGMDGKAASVIRTSGSMQDGEKWAEGDVVVVEDNCLNVVLKENSITTFVVK